MYGWRGRIGLLVPALNTTMEYDFNRMAPPGISVHVSRVATEAEGTIEALEQMGRSASESARLVAPARPHSVVFGCTSASFVNGPEWTERLEKEIGAVVSCPVVSTAGAMCGALRELRARRVTVLTPYVSATNDRLRDYLERSGFTVTDLRGLDMIDMYAHAEIPAETLYDAARKLDRTGADAVFIACTQLTVVGILDVLEADLGIPVVSAVQASFWAALRAQGGTGLPVTGFGSLLASGGAR